MFRGEGCETEAKILNKREDISTLSASKAARKKATRKRTGKIERLGEKCAALCEAAEQK